MNKLREQTGRENDNDDMFKMMMMMAKLFVLGDTQALSRRFQSN